MPPERALEILGFEVKNGLVDAELVRLFAEGKVWALTAGLRTGTA
jgi:hypothetical protein